MFFGSSGKWRFIMVYPDVFPNPKMEHLPTLPTILQPVTIRRNQHLFNTRSCCRGNSAQLQGSSMTSAMTDGRHFPNRKRWMESMSCFAFSPLKLCWSFAFNKNTKLSPKISWEFEATSLWCHLPKEIGPSQRTMVVHTKGRFAFSLVCSIIIKGIS